MNTEKSPSARAGALTGLRVLDLTSVVMGPYCTQALGDMGADVIKVESPEGDIIRQVGPERHPGMGPLFLNGNRSKRSVAIDLKQPAGRALLLKMATQADVLVYNVRPQAMARLGLSYEAVAAVNPRIVYAGLYGYGQGGPYAAAPAYDDLIQGASGMASLHAVGNGDDPKYVPAAVADRITGLAAIGQILAAVYERDRSGVGQEIGIPMFETMVSFVMADHLGGKSFEPALGPAGYARQLSAHRKPYRTADGYISALVYTDRHWRSLFQLMGREGEMERDPRFANVGARTRHVDAIYAELGDILRTQTTAHWLTALREADIPVAPLHDLDSIFDDPHLQATGFFTTEQHPSEGALLATRFPATWSRTQPGPTRPAPRFGEHAAEVLQETGLSPDEIQVLVDAGVVRVPPPP